MKYSFGNLGVRSTNCENLGVLVIRNPKSTTESRCPLTLTRPSYLSNTLRLEQDMLQFIDDHYVKDACYSNCR